MLKGVIHEGNMYREENKIEVVIKHLNMKGGV
jgi:hypothetical protein